MPSFFRVSCLLDFQIVVFSFAGKVKGRNIEVKLSIFGLFFCCCFQGDHSLGEDAEAEESSSSLYCLITSSMTSVTEAGTLAGTPSV